MKTNLTAAHLMFIATVLQEQLRVSNYPESYKKACKEIHGLISNSLDNIKIEFEDEKKKTKTRTQRSPGVRSGN